MEHPILTMRSAAHDIRGFLASASLATEHLSTHVDEQVAKRADRIARAIHQIVCICENDLVETQSPRTVTHHDSRSINAMLEQVAALITPQFEDRFGHPNFSVSVAEDIALDCDQTSLFRIIYNLAVNAAHAIRAHVGSRVDLSAVRDGCEVRFTVSDDGP